MKPYRVSVREIAGGNTYDYLTFGSLPEGAAATAIVACGLIDWKTRRTMVYSFDTGKIVVIDRSAINDLVEIRLKRQ